jgi:hypothetical protein
MTRAQAIHHIRVAGYHEDAARFARLYVENRISKPAATQAYRDGKKLRAAGIRCGCNICEPKSS